MLYGEPVTKKPIRWGMVGGGIGSQIGYIHRSSALRDRSFQLVAGAFDIVPERGKEFGTQLRVDVERCYENYSEMFSAESRRADGIQAVSIATPNSTHFEISKSALQYGFHVICEKPLCFTTEEADELVALSREKHLIVGVTYGYSGHQMIRQAREMVYYGDIGEVRLVQMQFAHGAYNWPIEKENASAAWRLDPKSAGPTFVLGDVGTHALYLGELICPDLKIKRLLCSRQSFVEERKLEDNAYVLMQYDNGAVGTLWASAMNSGSVHGQKIRVVGSKASIEWWDERPNQLTYEVEGKPVQILERGAAYLYPSALEEDRMSCGHAEGLFESWSNIYRRFAMAMDTASHKQTSEDSIWYPSVNDGAFGIHWIDSCVKSADAGEVWVDFE